MMITDSDISTFNTNEELCIPTAEVSRTNSIFYSRGNSYNDLHYLINTINKKVKEGLFGMHLSKPKDDRIASHTGLYSIVIIYKQDLISKGYQVILNDDSVFVGWGKVN